MAPTDAESPAVTIRPFEWTILILVTWLTCVPLLWLSGMFALLFAFTTIVIGGLGIIVALITLIPALLYLALCLIISVALFLRTGKGIWGTAVLCFLNALALGREDLWHHPTLLVLFLVYLVTDAYLVIRWKKYLAGACSALVRRVLWTHCAVL